MRHKWVSPFNLYESLVWGNKQQRRTSKPEESEKNVIRLARESVANGTENPLLNMTESLIQKASTSELGENLEERE